MAQSGYTPISLYYSSTTTNVPLAANLVPGELALNTADGKLFYKDSGGNVQTIASKAGNVNVSSISFGSTGLTPATATTGAVTVAGTLATANGGTNLTSFNANGAVYATSSSALATGTLPVASGGTGVTTTPANGSLLIGNGTGYTNATLTAGSNITITNSSGGISIAATSSGITTGKSIAMAMIFGF